MALDEIMIAERLARIENSFESLSARLDSNDALTQTIHELAADIKVLTQQVKAQGERIEQIISKYDAKLKEQGERIGAIEREPAHKWKTLVAQVTSLVVAALIGGVLAKFIN